MIAARRGTGGQENAMIGREEALEVVRSRVPRFADVIGQRGAVWRLQTAVAGDRLHHALLLDGPAGCGKTSVAVALAAALCCKRRPGRIPAPPPLGDLAGLPDPVRWPLEACGACPSCRKMPEHPDLSILDVEAGKAQIAIEQARAVIAEMGYRPHESAWRIVIVRNADLLSGGAANALLKSLEEPGAGNLFVLTTARPASLLPTIRSRCLRVPLRPLAPAVVRGLLASLRPGVPPEALDVAATLSAGGIARGMDLLAADAGESVRAAAAFGEAILAGNLAGILAAAESLAGDHADAGAGLDLLLVLLRDRIAAEAGVAPMLGATAGEAAEAYRRHPAGAAAVEGDLVARARRLAEANAKPQILLEWLGVASARAAARAGRGRSADG